MYHYKRRKLEKNESESSKKSERVENDFSFLDHKHTLEKLLYGYHPNDKVIEDIKDFWKFVLKYETLLKKAGKPVPRDKPVDTNTISIKRNCIFIRIDNKLRGTLESLIQFERSDLTKHRLDIFFDIITTYLDFKQKEKFTKLEKLRQCQKSLPVFKFKNDILESVEQNQVTIIAGDTGCGKSTQIPQYLYYHGYKNIVCTQPRRLACVALSKRVAHEMLSEYNTKVGYQIRFEKNKNKDTDICFITEGLLLRQLTVSHHQYDVIILDEIHERNLHGDFLLGVAKCLLRARANLKLILMSATINIGLFTKFFEEERTALIQVPGRLYPIRTYYMPPARTELQYNSKSKEERFNPEPYIQIMNLIDQKYPLNEKGDVLIFVSGVNEIETVIDAAKEYSEKQKHWIILPLHSGLSLADQDKVFDYASEGMRKCIVSTNIAETSVTVDGVRFVVDSGKMKEMIFDSSSKMQRLKEFWVSKSSAEQRKGRAGRTGPGVCYRIFSEKNFDQFDAYSTPEICRVPLDSMLLQMVAMGLPNVRLFPFIESPSKENIEQALLSLKQHGAIGPDEKITTLGKSLAMLPVDITIGKMLLMGCVFEELQRVLTLAAALSIQSPFTNRAFRDQKCELARRSMQSDQGDPLTLLNTYKEWLEQKWRRNENTRKWCRQIGIEEQRFYELSKLRNQFDNILKSCNLVHATDDVNLSSAERAMRNGEMRTLRAMRREHKMSAPNKRKVIRQSDLDRDEDLEEASDIRDVEFSLMNDSRKLDNLIQSASATSHREVLVLKVILVSGFYPQMAIPDEFNYCKNASQQFFHTFLKPFVSLHPNGQFADMTEILKITDSDIVEKPPFYTSKSPLSSAHQLLCYQNLLETTKPYLLNVVRMPAAQTLLLFALVMDTNTTVSKIICDSWLCLEFPFPEQGLHMLEKAIHIRKLWHKMLSDKLSEPLSGDGDKSQSGYKSKLFRREQSKFMDELTLFMKANVCYTICRLLPADLKEIYTQYSFDEHKLPFNPFNPSFEITANDSKGGYNVTDNVVYGCLRETPWSLVLQDELRKMEYVCENCGTEVELIGLSKLLHQKQCIQHQEEEKEITEEEVPKNSSSSSSTSAYLKKYDCELCSKSFQMTSIEILKHKRTCKK